MPYVFLWQFGGLYYRTNYVFWWGCFLPKMVRQIAGTGVLEDNRHEMTKSHTQQSENQYLGGNNNNTISVPYFLKKISHGNVTCNSSEQKLYQSLPLCRSCQICSYVLKSDKNGPENFQPISILPPLPKFSQNAPQTWINHIFREVQFILYVNTTIENKNP